MYEWTIPGKKEHSWSWYMVAGISMLSLAIWGTISGIYALTVVIVIMVGVYILLENNAPETTRAIINENGIGIGEVFYDYGQIQGFEIVYDSEVPCFIRISLKKNNLRTIDIPVTMIKEAEFTLWEIRAFLLQYLQEGEWSELNFVDRIIEKLGL